MNAIETDALTAYAPSPARVPYTGIGEVTASGVQALHLAPRSVLDPGDKALILSPAWPNGSSIVALSHATPVELPLLLEDERYWIDFAALEVAALAPGSAFSAGGEGSVRISYAAENSVLEPALERLERFRRAGS